MVQIILIPKRLTILRDIWLYIPHGSDNTQLDSGWEKEVANFISHMVQIIQFLNKKGGWNV